MTGFLIRRVLQALLVLFLVPCSRWPSCTFSQAARSGRCSAPGRPRSRSPTTTSCTASTSRSSAVPQVARPAAARQPRLLDQAQPVRHQPARAGPAEDAILVSLGLVVSLLFGIPLGVYQAVKRNTVGDYVLTGVSFLGYATPTFFLGLLLIDGSPSTSPGSRRRPRRATPSPRSWPSGAWCCRWPPIRWCCTRCSAGTCGPR